MEELAEQTTGGEVMPALAAANVSTTHVDRLVTTTTTNNGKRHPADLISTEHPDPHESPLSSPTPEPDSAAERRVAEQIQTNANSSDVPPSSTPTPTPPTLSPEQTNGVVHVPPAFEAAQPAAPDAIPSTSQTEPVPTPINAPSDAPAPVRTPSQQHQQKKERDPQRTRKQLGEYTLTKTLGAGSMGKVKLGVSTVTGEKVAIKVVPRFTSTAAAHKVTEKKEQERRPSLKGEANAPPPASALKPSPSTLAKAAAKDASKEVRTMREGSIGLLLHHPYVCGMKSMVLYPHHYYMVYEYINGGQMLDYIISHGRLRERSARKFARQIGSALEYCHANSIVHRDLKIENILISKTGNIKIIDFGLSNLYSPQALLNTFCGSLYFAAPELLNAKLYTGPEVDVWSFGIVLYVLVCGKVPFDDQSMPALHAKIKRGQVEYPAWLSTECKHLMSRMLVTNPSHRATLTEVLTHPWMVKGYAGPPDSHLPARAPLRPDEIDPEIVKGMVGFEFGTADEIIDKLVELVQSDLYRQTVRNWEQRANTVDEIVDSKDRPATRVDGKDLKRSPTSKRFSNFGFYGKKIANNLNAAFSSNDKKDADDMMGGSGGSTATLVSPVKPELMDPTRGFDPLLSIYYLVKEKQEREKIYGPGHFASSTVSLTGPPPPPVPMQAYQSGSIVPPQPEPARRPPGREPEPVEIVAPSAAASGAGTGSGTPRMPLTPQPRQRATGEEHFLTAPPAAGQQSTRFQPRSAPTTPVIPASQRASMHEASRSDAEDTPSLVRRFGSLLSRSGGSNDGQHRSAAHRHRASVSGTSGHRGTTKAPASLLPQVTEGHFGGSDVPLPSPPDGQGVQRASTVGNMSPSARHKLSASEQAPVTPVAVAVTTGREQTGGKEVLSDGEQRAQVDTDDEQRPALGTSPESAKPVWLKGLFSVSTTTTKPTAVIRSDLVRVLDRLGVQYRDVKSGFECVHMPSIDMTSVSTGAAKKASSPTDKTPRRRASKLFLHAGASSKERAAVDMSRSSLHGMSGTGTTAVPGTSTSWTVLPSNAATTIPHAPSTQQRSNVNEDLIVRFEIFIVKMPLLPGIHGIQFRRVKGDAWSYSVLAKRVLQELKL